MPRFFLVDNATDFILADTADLPAHRFAEAAFPVTQADLKHNEESAIIVARWFDEAVQKIYNRRYEAVRESDLAANETGYSVWCSDYGGEDAMPPPGDYIPEDDNSINAVFAECRYIASVRCCDSDI